MLMLESMDEDTETRRLSPIAVLSEGYINLINGPQHHRRCFGSTCRKGLSTFPILVATGEMILLTTSYDVNILSYTPYKRYPITRCSHALIVVFLRLSTIPILVTTGEFIQYTIPLFPRNSYFQMHVKCLIAINVIIK